MNISINKLKIFTKIFIDFVIVFISLYLAIIINAEKILPLSKSYIALGFIISSLQLTALYYFKNYSEFTRYFDYENILRILTSLFLTSLFLIVLSYFAVDNTKIIFRFLNPKILTIYSTTFIFLNILFKIIAKYYLITFHSKKKSKDKKKYVIYGAGITGFELRKILKNYEDIELLYFVDDDKNKIGRTVDGLEINSSKLIEKDKKNIDQVLICMPSASSFEINYIIKSLDLLSVKNRNISSKENFLSEENNKNDFKKINFDRSTILNQNFSKNLVQNFENKKILVTGAGGTIGRELMFQISRLNINSLVGVDFNELNLSNLKKDFENLDQKKNINNFFYLLNLNNKNLLTKIIDKHEPDIIFHAAAYKHVDVVENNPIEAVTNNLIGLINMLECTKNKNNLSFIFVSTDKAVNPINHMGRSKRMGEIMVCSMNEISKKNNYSCVRFGNVIGSSGSLIPILNEQISKGGPITITDKEATRYFMTVQDAVNLTIEASDSKNRGLINVLNMGKSINIYSMVLKILKDSNIKIINGLEKNGIRIEFIGLRPGEKLHEELFHENKIQRSDDKKIFKEICDIKISEEELIDIRNKIDEANIKNETNILQNVFSKYFS